MDRQIQPGPARTGLMIQLRRCENARRRNASSLTLTNAPLPHPFPSGSNPIDLT